ncbi:MAG: type IIA DNA topoisomerase subunit B [Candidatus Ancillula sp.]|nr:type IIA DNA topoisomerase subunit B [Candidatus Ancillula sp.]
MAEKENSYTGSDLTVLEGLEAVRKRPGMYIGTTDARGLMHCLWEIIDNAVDEALGGFCTEILVTLNDDESVTVKDNGRGIPVDVEPKTGLSGVEVVMTKLHAGGKFGNSAYSASGGLHGVGASVVNALSEWLEVEVTRNAKVYKMGFSRGNVQEELHIIGSAHKNATGTTVKYLADRQIFPKSAHFSYSDLEKRARQTSFLVPGLRIVITDDRINETGQKMFETEEHPQVQEFMHLGGSIDFVDFLAPDEKLTEIWHFNETGHFSEVVQTLEKDAKHLVAKEVQRDCNVDLALRWGTGFDTTFRSFVNIISTPGGGTHQAGFETALLKVVRSQVQENSRKLKITAKELQDLKIEKDDILAGLTAVLTVRFPEPQFEGQTKEILGTGPVKKVVQNVVEQKLTEIFSSKKPDVKNQALLVLEKAVNEMHARLQARKQKDLTRRKNALESSSFPAKLADCRSDEVDKTELFIVEGDSALGTAKLARDSNFQALMPIRGKILNVQKATLSSMLNNAECAAIIQVVGAGSGRDFDVSLTRYSKVIMMTDADVDGAHIRTLLLTLFWKYMRPLVESGKVYAAVPPLHRIELVGRGLKDNEKYIYTYTDEELQLKLSELDAAGKKYKDDIQRYKGLGEMDADQLAETTMDPQHRLLRRVKLVEAEEAAKIAEETFELLMGDDVPPRKDFIIASADAFDRSKIDA